MKKLKFVLSLFLTFLLTSCIFNRIVPVKKISSINANIVEKTRVEGDFFDINDINISLTYNDESTKDINYVDLEENDLIALFYYPGSSPESENPKYRLPADDFILDAPGEWTLLISNYDEKQKLLFEPFSINHFDVDILYIQAESFSLSDTSLSLSVDESQIITTYITPANTSSLVTWSSSDKSVATVDSDGKVTAVSEGQCTITAEIDGLSSTCIVTVVPYEETLYRFTNKQFNSSNGDWTYSKVGTSFNSTNARGVEEIGRAHV